MLNFSWRQTVPCIIQSEMAECGLACLAMAAGFHGHAIDLPTLRSRHAISLRGTTMRDLIRLAGALDMTPRAVKLDVGGLRQLQLPCVLHWDLNHFVVLVRMRGDRVTIHDPAKGPSELRLADLGKHFTGNALELRPTPEFRPRLERRPVSLRPLLGGVAGMGSQVTHIILLAAVLQVLAVIAPFHMQWLVDHALVSRDHDLIAVLGTGFLLLVIAQSGVTALRAWLLTVLGTTVGLQMQSALFQRLLRLPMPWFAKRQVGDVQSKFDSLGEIQRTLTTTFFTGLIDGVMAIVTLVLMLCYSLKLSAVVIVATLLYGALRLALYAPTRRASEERITLDARQHSHFLESLRSIQTVKLAGQEEQRSLAWLNKLADTKNAETREARLSLVHQTLHSMLSGIENVVTLWIGGLLVLDPAAGFSVGMLFAFTSYKTQFVHRVGALIDNGVKLIMLSLHAERVGDIVEADPEPTPALIPHTVAMKAPASVSLRNVGFQYGEADPFVVRGVNLEIAAGESVVIVGPSGGGKTTLAKIILGLYPPTEGQVFVDGELMNRQTAVEQRHRMASVMQDDTLQMGTIAQNICSFDATPDQPRIEACTKMAAVHDDIMAMPMKYHSLVGDMGSTLSGGQKQRVLMARALYRQPALLILDEATSHLDIVRERWVNDAVRSLPLTRIIVAHRPETIASADRVVALVDGQLVESNPVEMLTRWTLPSDPQAARILEAEAA